MSDRFHFPVLHAPTDASAGESVNADASGDAASSNDADQESGALVRVGFVFRPHGVHGELKVKPETSDPEQFETFEQVQVGADAISVQTFTVASVRYQQTKRGTTVILRLDEVDSRDAAEKITKQSVFVDEEQLTFDEEELLIHDMIGMAVTTTEGDALGTVANVLEHPAHLTVVVHRHEGGELLLPFVADFIHDVDLEHGQMIVELIEGMNE